MKAERFLLPLILVPAFLGCPSKSDTSAPTDPGKTATPVNPNALKELKKDISAPGEGEAAANGDFVIVTYTGKLADGSVFDSNTEARQNPFNVDLGTHGVIAGWEEGLVGAKKGEKVKLSIPAAKGYGAAAQAKIPANSDLFFDIVVLDVIKAKDRNAAIITHLEKGSGPTVAVGDTVTVHYKLTLANGKVIDDIKADKPISFKLGNKEVPNAIDYTLQGQTVGSRIKFRLPPGKALGSAEHKLTPDMVTYFDMTIDKKS